MDIEKLIEAVRLCGSTPKVDQCKQCAAGEAVEWKNCYILLFWREIMKITIDMENLQSTIEEAAKINTKNAVNQAIMDIAHAKVDSVLRGRIEEIVNESIVGYVNDYLKTTKIHIGGGWDSDNVEEYTAEEYLKKQVKDVFESQSFTVKQKNRWDNMEEEKVSFQEYLQKHLDIEAEVKPYMDKMAKRIRDDVNQKVKALFDDAMRSTLAENVFAIVSASDTYRSISNSLKMLGD